MNAWKQAIKRITKKDHNVTKFNLPASIRVRSLKQWKMFYNVYPEGSRNTCLLNSCGKKISSRYTEIVKQETYSRNLSIADPLALFSVFLSDSFVTFNLFIFDSRFTLWIYKISVMYTEEDKALIPLCMNECSALSIISCSVTNQKDYRKRNTLNSQYFSYLIIYFKCWCCFSVGAIRALMFGLTEIFYGGIKVFSFGTKKSNKILIINGVLSECSYAG